MARAKKVTKYVISMKLPDDDDGWRLMWANRQNYTLDTLMALCDERDLMEGGKKELSLRKFYSEKLAGYDVNESNWRDVDAYNGMKYGVSRLLRAVYPVSAEYKKVNEDFFAEYNSREDLQEFYKKFAAEVNWLYTVDGKHHARGQYYQKQEEEDRQFWDAFNEAPLDYTCYAKVANQSGARIFLEQNRETPWGAGELVKLRTGYVGHPDHDPLYVSRYNAFQTGQTTPDKTVDRIGTVMKVTDTVPWRASKGSKVIEVLWLGQEQSVHVPEKVLKFETRPTRKNGLLK